MNRRSALAAILASATAPFLAWLPKRKPRYEVVWYKNDGEPHMLQLRMDRFYVLKEDMLYVVDRHGVGFPASAPWRRVGEGFEVLGNEPA